MKLVIACRLVYDGIFFKKRVWKLERDRRDYGIEKNKKEKGNEGSQDEEELKELKMVLKNSKDKLQVQEILL